MDGNTQKFCINCEHHQADTENGKIEHLCFKGAEEVTDLVTGEKVCLHVVDCYDERQLNYDTRFCSVEGHHFKKKGVIVNATDTQQTNVSIAE